MSFKFTAIFATYAAFVSTAVMGATKKKGGAKSQNAPPKKKQKNEFFTAKGAKEDDLSDHSDSSDEEEVLEHEEFDGDEQDFGSGSDISSDGDDPLANDFLQGSDDEGIMFLDVYSLCSIYIYVSSYSIIGFFLF